MKIATQVPAFEKLRQQTFNHLNTLRHYKDSYIVVTEELNNAIVSKLQKSRLREIEQVLYDFEGRYPMVVGIEELRQDLNHYNQLSQALKKKDLQQLSQLLDRSNFQTPPFNNALENLKRTALPDSGVLTKYRQSLTAWRSGDIKTALALLEELPEEGWGKAAKETLAQYKKIVVAYDALKATELLENNDETRLMPFYKMLNWERDSYFLNAIGDDIKLYRSKALAALEITFPLANQKWQAYLDNDGIRGVLRLETGVSESYRKQAALLSQAYSYVDDASRIYRLLKIPLPEKWTTLLNEITTEIRFQQRSLENLRMVLDSQVLRKKLALLPNLGNAGHEP